MPRLPTAPPHTRFFGRLDRFACECPACGTILQATYDPAKLRRRRPTVHGKRRQAAPIVFNAITSRLRCPACRTMYTAGLILWPVTGRPSPSQPADQKPTRAQLLQLRQYATGFLMHEKLTGAPGEHSNVAVLAECRCPISSGGWAPACPIHGWEATQAAQEALKGGVKAEIAPLLQGESEGETEE